MQSSLCVRTYVHVFLSLVRGDVHTIRNIGVVSTECILYVRHVLCYVFRTVSYHTVRGLLQPQGPISRGTCVQAVMGKHFTSFQETNIVLCFVLLELPWSKIKVSLLSVSRRFCAENLKSSATLGGDGACKLFRFKVRSGDKIKNGEVCIRGVCFSKFTSRPCRCATFLTIMSVIVFTVPENKHAVCLERICPTRGGSLRC